jgi:hypothetical protein
MQLLITLDYIYNGTILAPYDIKVMITPYYCVF